jgi:DNA-binding SARP family transcriptional activator
LASYHLANQAPREAIHYIEKALPLDTLNEDLYCLAMRAYAGMHDQAKVMRVYSDLENILLTELNAAPLLETTSLYQELKSRSR